MTYPDPGYQSPSYQPAQPQWPSPDPSWPPPQQSTTPRPHDAMVPVQPGPPVSVPPVSGPPTYPAVPTPAPPTYIAVPVKPVKSTGAAVALEIVPGIFGIFGIGNLYAGNTGIGIALMLSFWALFWVNFLLVFLFIGMITMPVTWIAYLVLGPVLAARAVEKHNSRMFR